MTRIEAVEAHPLRLPPDRPAGREEECFLLRIVTEDGIEGWGEAQGSAYICRAVIDAPVTHVTAQGLRALLAGRELVEVAAMRRLMDEGTQWIGRDGAVMQAIAAAELALWDIAGKRAGLPVAELLRAGSHHRRLPCYASGKVAPTPEGTAARITGERAAGFTAHKIGWPPFGLSETSDVAFLEASRDAAPDALLMVDAAQAFDEATAQARAQAFARFDLAWIEEPLDRDDLAGQARLRVASPVPIASGEGECGLPGLLRVAAVVDVLQPDITRCGLVAATRAAAQAPKVCSHSFTTSLNAIAHAHWLASLPNGWMLEWPVAKIAMWDALFPGAPRPVDGHLSLPNGPGWGVTPDLEVLRRLAMSAAEEGRPGWDSRRR